MSFLHLLSFIVCFIVRIIPRPLGAAVAAGATLIAVLPLFKVADGFIFAALYLCAAPGALAPVFCADSSNGKNATDGGLVTADVIGYLSVAHLRVAPPCGKDRGF
jgi:hypothetical protein